MKRTDFIKKIIGLFGVAVLPTGFLVSYRKIYLLLYFICSSRFYEGPQPLKKLKTRDLLKQVRKPGNKYDTCIASLPLNKPNRDHFYNSLAIHRQTGEVQNLVHHDIGSTATMKTIVKENLLVVNRKNYLYILNGDILANVFDNRGLCGNAGELGHKVIGSNSTFCVG